MRPEDLSGLIDADQGDVLRALAAAVPAELAIVEIGSFRGKSTAFLAAGAKAGAGARVWAVDPWDLPGNPYGKHGFSAPQVREQFEEQIRACRLWSRVTPVRAFSADAAAAWDGPAVGLLFIDGDHEEAAVRADVAAWTPRLAAEHVLVFDDLDTRRNPGVRTVVDELADRYVVEKVAVRFGVARPW
jgi:hypothetical protein